MQNPAVNIAVVHNWLFKKTTEDDARAELLAKGMEEELIAAHLLELKKQRWAGRQTNGFILMGLGAFLGFISCVAAITGILPEWKDFILYGLTFIGVSLACWGMYLLFEK